MDIAPYIKAKSDQLNADDLTGGPITVRIEAVTKGQPDQPVVIKVNGGHMPFKPSKTALRVLAAAWGTDSSAWVGRWITLYRDPAVTWAGVEVGGIRIQALSHIDKPMTLSLAVSRGKKQSQKIGVIKPEQSKPAGAPTADLDALLRDAELTRADVDRWRKSVGKPPLSDLAPDQEAQLAAWLGGDESRLAAIRAVPPDDAADTADPDSPIF